MEPEELRKSEASRLRDMFAGLVICGAVAGRGDRQLAAPEVYATWAYKAADAMLAARSAKPDTTQEKAG